MMINKKQKQGQIGIVIFFAAIFLILLVGFTATIIWGAADMVSDEITPVMKDLGMVDSANLSEYSGYAVGTFDTIVQAFPWVIGLSYVMALVFVIVFILIVGYNPHPAFIAFFIGLMFLLILGSVLMSNIYQDIYSQSDDLAQRLQEQTLMSYMILHSPWILSLIAIIGGVVMFTRIAVADPVSMPAGGYGI